MTKEAAFEGMSRFIQKMTERVGATFTKPDDDWYPVLFLMTARGLEVHDVRGDKDEMPVKVERLMLQTNPTYAALLISAYVSTVQVDADRPELLALALERIDAFGPSNDPERSEALFLETADHFGQHALWEAAIHRHTDKPPTLGEWEKDRFSNNVAGRLSGLLRRCFQKIGEVQS